VSKPSPNIAISAKEEQAPRISHSTFWRILEDTNMFLLGLLFSKLIKANFRLLLFDFLHFKLFGSL
jgi:hypothetical protein